MWGNPIQAVGARDFQTTAPAALHIEQAAKHPAMVMPLAIWARPGSELAWEHRAHDFVSVVLLHLTSQRIVQV